MGPLTRVLELGAEQFATFNAGKHFIAFSVLLYFLNFSKPSDVYTDASNVQYRGIICQDSHLIVFYI
jgi:hypothetical protein